MFDTCTGCHFLNKPYWSIINPCDSCYKKNGAFRAHSTDSTVAQDFIASMNCIYCVHAGTNKCLTCKHSMIRDNYEPDEK